mgnify:CR=1 FL=1
MTTVKSLWLTMVGYKMIACQAISEEFKEWETTQVENPLKRVFLSFYGDTYTEICIW